MQKIYNDTGTGLEVFDAKAAGPTRSALINLAWERDEALLRNKIYLALMGLLIAAMAYVCATAGFKTYVVRVDAATGRIDAGKLLTGEKYEPREAEIRYFLSQFVKDVRSVPLDPVLFRSSWEKAQHFLTARAAQRLNETAKKEGTVQKLGQVTVLPAVLTVQIVPGSERTYSVRWVEESFASGGKAARKAFYSGQFTVIVEQVKNEDEMLVNPLGLKIADFNWAKESGPALELGKEDEDDG